MPLQNRVDPFGLIHAVSDRGTFMGNRGGCFHTKDKTLKSTHWKTRQWITCVLKHKDWHRDMMQPRQYTELFFLDEATSLAAGHRPCYLCRYDAATRFRAALVRSGTFGPKPRASEISDAIAGEMQSVLNLKQARHQVETADLPDGTMFTTGSTAYLKWQGFAHPWQFSGYGEPMDLPAHAVRLTPAATCAALAHGYRPSIHPSLNV